MRKLLGILCFAAVTLLACGGSDSTKETPPTANTAPSQASPEAAAATATTAPEPPPTVEAVASPAAAPEPSPTPEPGPLSSIDSDRITIPSIGVDAPLVAFVVSGDGVMADPRPNVGVYDLSAHSGLGGRPGEGNLIVAANIGNNDGPLGSYENFGLLAKGAEISFTLNGEAYTYSVVVRCVSPRSELQPVFNTTEAAALTLMQNLSDEGDAFYGGTQYVIAELEVGTVAPVCPAGSERP